MGMNGSVDSRAFVSLGYNGDEGTAICGTCNKQMYVPNNFQFTCECPRKLPLMIVELSGCCIMCERCGNENSPGFYVPDDMWDKYIGDPKAIICLNCLGKAISKHGR